MLTLPVSWRKHVVLLLDVLPSSVFNFTCSLAVDIRDNVQSVYKGRAVECWGQLR